MTYDLVKAKYPRAPAQLGAGVRESTSGRLGRIVPPIAGLGECVRVRFEGEILARNVHPTALAFAPPTVAALPCRCTDQPRCPRS
ncbi:hypothetical protein [Methylobacterium sp. JK268]